MISEYKKLLTHNIDNTFQPKGYLIRFLHILSDPGHYKKALLMSDRINQYCKKNSIGVVHLFSKKNNNFLTGLDWSDNYQTYDDYELFFRSIIDFKRPLYIWGDCNGAWPAFYFATKFNARRALIINPQSYCDRQTKLKTNDLRWVSDDFHYNIHQHLPSKYTYQDITSMKNILEKHRPWSTDFDLYYCKENKLDTTHAFFFKEYNMKLIPVDNSSHETVGLKITNHKKEFIDSLIKISINSKNRYIINKLKLNDLPKEFIKTDEVLHTDSNITYFGLHRNDLLESVVGLKIINTKKAIVICKAYTLPKFRKKGNYKALLNFITRYLDDNYSSYFKVIWSKEHLNIKKILGDEYLERQRKIFKDPEPCPYILYIKNPT